MTARVLLCCLLLSLAPVSCVIRKCCSGLEVLKRNDSSYRCELEEHIIPLHITGPYEVSFPDVCAQDECLDKTEGGELLELRCPEEVKSRNERKAIVHHKCCPDGMVYDLDGKYCRKSADLYELTSFYRNQTGVIDIRVGVPDCKRAIVDILAAHGVSVVPDEFYVQDVLTADTFVVRRGSYCVDRSASGHTVVRSCQDLDVCRSRMCLAKCCASGEIFAPDGDRYGCRTIWEDSARLHSPYAGNHTHVALPSLEKVVLIDTIQCPNGRYLFDKTLPYEFFPNGTLKQNDVVFAVTDRKYCLENIKSNPETSVLVCFEEEAKQVETKFFFYFTGLVVSSVFLMLTLLVYFFLPELQNLHGRTVMCHVSSLLAAFVCLSLVQRKTTYEITQCVTLGYSIYFTFLAAFSWLNVMCFDIWWTFGMVRMPDKRKSKEIKRFLLYCLYSFGLPFVLTVVTMVVDYGGFVAVDFRPKLGGQRCWFDLEKPYAHAIFFIAPIAIQILANCVMFALTAYHCIKVKKEINRIADSNTSKKKTFLVNRETFMMNLKLSVVMGISWIFEIVSTYVDEPKYLWYALDSINILQGLWIFCIFVLKEKVWRALKHKFGYKVGRESSLVTQTTSGKNSISSMTNAKLLNREDAILMTPK